MEKGAAAAYQRLEARFEEIYHLISVAELAEWYSMTTPTSAGQTERGLQIGALRKMAHELLVAKACTDDLGIAETDGPWQEANLSRDASTTCSCGEHSR